MKRLINPILKKVRTVGLLSGNTRIKLFTLLLISIMGNQSKAQTISRFAGPASGIAGYAGDGSSATLSTARIVTHFGVAPDASGNVYFAQANHHRIRYVDASGNLQTLAGTGTAGFWGDGGTASAAQLSSPMGVAVDASGNVYIGDVGNNCIRKVNTSKVITTIAGTPGSSGYSGDGGPATAATLNNPVSLAVDASGNIYFADNGNYAVRMIEASTGKIYTVAGNGSSGFSGDGGPATAASMIPTGVAVSGSYLYIADPNNRRVRIVDALGVVTGTVNTFAGTGTAGYSGDCGAAVSADLGSPFAVATGPGGEVFIADEDEHVVRMVDVHGIITTFAGDGTNAYTGDGGPATAAQMKKPVAVGVDASRNVYIADMGVSANVIRKVTQATGTAPNTPSNPDQPWYSSSNSISGINTASIVYGSTTSGILFGSDYFDGTTNSTIYVEDPAVGGANIATTNKGGVPDIIIGNCTGTISSICSGCSSSTHYILASAYVNPSSEVQIDFYDVEDDPSTFTISISALSSATHKLTGYAPQHVHIDLVAEAGNTSTTGRPFCNRYVVTFDDFSTPSNPMIYIAYGDLNSGSLGTPVQVNPTSGTAVYGYSPDVSLIERSGPLRDIALVTYVDAAGNQLYYQEYDFSSSAATAVTTLDNGSGSSAILNPRIDAIDDFSVNSSSTISKYKVVAQVQNCANSEIRTYDNLLSGSTPSYFTSSQIIDIFSSTNFAPGYNHYFPSVAVGSNSGNDYNVLHFTVYSPGVGILFMEPVDISTPSAITSSGYYHVNSSTGAPTAVAASGNCSVSTPANDISYQTLYAWTYINSSTGNFDVDYKLPATTYGFKTAPTSNASGEERTWQLYPNPVSDVLTISSNGGNAATAYKVVDILGRLIMQGEVNANIQKINVSELTKGNYIIRLYKDQKKDATMLFTKD